MTATAASVSAAHSLSAGLERVEQLTAQARELFAAAHPDAQTFAGDGVRLTLDSRGRLLGVSLADDVTARHSSGGELADEINGLLRLGKL